MGRSSLVCSLCIISDLVFIFLQFPWQHKKQILQMILLKFLLEYYNVCRDGDFYALRAPPSPLWFGGDNGGLWWPEEASEVSGVYVAVSVAGASPEGVFMFLV